MASFIGKGREICCETSRKFVTKKAISNTVTSDTTQDAPEAMSRDSLAGRPIWVNPSHDERIRRLVSD